MQNDKRITISVAGSRKATNWQPQSMLLSELWQKLSAPTQGRETLAMYLGMKKYQQDDLKDIGGFVGGELAGRRKKINVKGRDLITLDLDNLPPGSTSDVLLRCSGLGAGYCVYSTRKHSPDAPRLRIVLPTDRTLLPEEYEPIARMLAQMIQPDMTWFDPTTFQMERLMYWPSRCADAEYVFTYGDKPFLYADGMLALYPNWQDVSAWPVVPGEAKLRDRSRSKQGDPTEKQGVVGAFCRVYDVPAAMETYLPGVYTETDIPRRYTFIGGSTAGGAVLYDDGKFLYSHHATDPCSGVLVNAFDLVRLHKFGDEDDTSKEDTPVNRLPSYSAMCEFAMKDVSVSGLLKKERYEKATAEFANMAGVSGVPQAEADNANWMDKLAVHPKTGKTEATMNNIWVILEDDPNLKGRFALNEFAGRGEILGPLPWDEAGRRRLWEDNDNEGLYWYMEHIYGISSNRKIDGSLSLHCNKHKFNDIVDYLNALVWDGVSRLDTLFIDYLGVEDSEHARAVTRKAFTAAVARALQPGTKFDYMTILTGSQGIGKSTIIAKMSLGFFNDSIRTFEGKEASELLQNVWLVEISELEAFNKTETGRIKQFLSQQHDRFRAAYGRHVKETPRRCVFFGTTNEEEFLVDKTGNRRFWALVCNKERVKKNLWQDLTSDEIAQVWAEALMRYRLGEKLYLDDAIEAQAKEVQEHHRKHSVREGIIQDYLDEMVPVDWSKWDLSRRVMYLQGAAQYEGELMRRQRVCALEVWCEALSGDMRYIKNSDAAEINAIINSLPGWKRMPRTAKFGYCKTQRGFERI